jgi:hypothetical protein
MGPLSLALQHDLEGKVSVDLEVGGRVEALSGPVFTVWGWAGQFAAKEPKLGYPAEGQAELLKLWKETGAMPKLPMAYAILLPLESPPEGRVQCMVIAISSDDVRMLGKVSIAAAEAGAWAANLINRDQEVERCLREKASASIKLAERAWEDLKAVAEKGLPDCYPKWSSYLTDFLPNLPWDGPGLEEALLWMDGHAEKATLAKALDLRLGGEGHLQAFIDEGLESLRHYNS